MPPRHKAARLGGVDLGETSSAVIDNRTGLPDEVIRETVMAHWVENAAMQLGMPTTFQLYATSPGTSIMNRSPFRAPSSVIEEIRLARDVVDTDDDVAAVVSQMIHTAFRDGMQNQHPDEKTMQLFNRIAWHTNLDVQLKELLREYIISGQLNTVQLFTRSRLSFNPDGTDDKVTEQIQVPLIGVLPAENIRVISNDLFGQGELAYEVTEDRLKEWLGEYHSPRTSNARKAQMRAENPVIAALFVRAVEIDWNDQDLFSRGKTLYVLNPRMVHRTTMPKGAAAYPRPRLTANFALLEAKRLLNIMDYALLQGGTNYIVVAKQGSDQRPGTQPEIDNLTDQVRAASRTGVLVGDHRIDIDIITPDLTELLNPGKRKLLGRKIAMALLCVSEEVPDDSGAEGIRREATQTENTITSDRRDIKRHVERFVYEEIVTRNPTAFKKGPPSLWFSRVVLAGAKDFYEQVVKARDRGDIPRKWAVEILGFDYEAGVAQRKREKEAGDDEVMVPGNVPFDSPQNQIPGDTGRPPGSSSDNGRPGGADPVAPQDRQTRRRLAAPRARRGGEPVRAQWDPEREQTVRIGEVTAALMEEYPEASLGRVSATERQAVTASEVYQSGPVVVVPVNPSYATTEVRAFALEEGLRLVIGQRDDGALVAKALCFREPHWQVEQAIERAERWGFPVERAQEDPPDLPAAPREPQGLGEVLAAHLAAMGPEEAAQTMRTLFTEFAKAMKSDVTIVMPEEGDKEIVRDEHGAIAGVRRRVPEVTQ